MNVLVISTNRNRFPFPVMPLGACMIAEAAERAGHRVSLLDLMFERDARQLARREIERLNPDVIGLSVRNIDNNDIHSPAFYVTELGGLCDEIRSVTSAPVILGGAAVSVMPGELLRYTGVPWAVMGDGEKVFPMVLERLAKGESPEGIPGVGWLEAGGLRVSPSPLPPKECSCWTPDFHRWIDLHAYLSRLTTVPLQTKLGCRFDCVYCTYRKIEGRTYRLSPPEEVAGVVARLASQGLRHIEFVDNVFNSPYDHALAICENIAGIRNNGRARASLQSLEINPLFVDDDLVRAMERAGFAGIGITVESASDRVLEGLAKGFTAAHVHKAAEVVRRHKLPCVWIFMAGGPNETRETVRETLEFAERNVRPQDVVFFGLGIRIYPGTGLESIARRQGLLSLPPAEMLSPVFYLSPEVELDWLISEVKSHMSRHMNFMSPESLSFPLLPAILRLAYGLGFRSPLWRHTRQIRRGLRLLGMDA